MTQRRIVHAKSPIDLRRTLRRELQRGSTGFVVTASGELGLICPSGEGGVLARLRPAEAEGPGTTIVVEVEGPPEAADAAVETVRRVFSLDLDLAPLHAALGDDPLIGPLLRRFPGLRTVRAPDLFGCLIETIIAQQINRAFARALNHRLIELYGRPLELDGVTHRLFPAPGALARLHVEALRALQFSARKAEYVIACARAVDEGRLDLQELAELPDEAFVARVTRLRGVGTWSAHCLLLFGLGRPDAFPEGDAGLRNALRGLLGDDEPLTGERIAQRAERWRPWRSYAALHLWETLAPDALAGTQPTSPVNHNPHTRREGMAVDEAVSQHDCARTGPLGREHPRGG